MARTLCFLKTRAIFMLVWNPDFEEGEGADLYDVPYRNQPLSYWLEYVQTLGPKDPPILVVQSRCDRLESEVKLLPVDEAYLNAPHVRPCYVSAKIPRGLAELRDAISEAIQHLQKTERQAKIGIGRFKVLEQLEAWRTSDQVLPAEKRQYRTLTVNDYNMLCDRVGNISSKEYLLEYLHDIGAGVLSKRTVRWAHYSRPNLGAGSGLYRV